MSRVIVGVDPHKKSVTIEAVDEHGLVLGRGRYGTDTAGYQTMLTQVRDQWPRHRWAVEGAQGVGRPLAQRLLAQGEDVVDVPAKLAARVRVFDTGNARKTDATDAHAVAMVALRTVGLRELAFDEELLALRLLVDRRDELAKLRLRSRPRHRVQQGRGRDSRFELGRGQSSAALETPRYLVADHRPPRPVVDTTRSHAAEHQLRYRYAGTDDEPGTRPALDARRLTLMSGRFTS